MSQQTQHKLIKLLFEKAICLFQSNDTSKPEIVWKKQAFDLLDTASESIKQFRIKDSKIIEQEQSLRNKYDKTYQDKQEKMAKPNLVKHQIKDKYMKKIQSMFPNSTDHRQFALILQSIEESPLKQMPLIINKHIAEFSTGKIYNCSDNDCKNEILIMNKDKDRLFTNYVYCSKTNRCWCKQHMIDTEECEECEAIKWIPESILCDAYDCQEENQYICQNDDCCYYVNREQRCSICSKIFCRSWEHDEELGLYHCDECKNLCCMNCWINCIQCNKNICKCCVTKYAFECDKKSSKECGESIADRINHPLCERDCQCLVEQKNTCFCCVEHSCPDWKKVRCRILTLDDWNTDCKGTNCNICKAIAIS